MINGKFVSDYNSTYCKLFFGHIFLPTSLNANASKTNLITLNSSNHQMFLTPTESFEVKRVILNLPNSFSVCPDEVLTSLIKDCVDLI
jgi:hypothetical protein